MSVHGVAAWGSIAAVGLAVAAGLWLAGSPSEQRLLRLDQRRTADLRQLASLLEARWQAEGRLPANLNTLVDGQRLSQLPLDPASKAPYEYRTTGPRSFELCAVFSAASGEEAPKNFWSHGAGRQCYSFDASSPQGDRR